MYPFQPQRNSLPGERITEVFPTKCFVGLEKVYVYTYWSYKIFREIKISIYYNLKLLTVKDVTGAIKVPEKVWPDKAVYDLAEKEYYEKLEKVSLSLSSFIT